MGIPIKRQRSAALNMFTLCMLALAALTPACVTSQRSCTVSGRVYSSGSTFQLTLAGPCVTFTCRDGEVFPGTYGCQRDGRCYPEGDSYNIGCIKMTCGFNGYGGLDYQRANDGCSYLTQCLAVNETYTDGCYQYQCRKQGSGRGVSYSVDLVDWGCKRAGQCYKEGQTLEIGCRTIRCEKNNNIIGFVNVEQGCTINGGCLKVGEAKEDACRSLRCSKDTVNGVPFYSLNVDNVRCQDANLDCQPAGSLFDYNFNGVVRHNCTCRVQGVNVQYFC